MHHNFVYYLDSLHYPFMLNNIYLYEYIFRGEMGVSNTYCAFVVNFIFLLSNGHFKFLSYSQCFI